MTFRCRDPECDSEEFVVKIRVSGRSERAYRFDGEPADNTHIWDYLHDTEAKRAHCRDCGKFVGLMKDLVKS